LVAVIWVLILAPGPDGMMNGFLELITFGRWMPRDFLRDLFFNADKGHNWKLNNNLSKSGQTP
jgi:hypothetical protein